VTRKREGYAAALSDTFPPAGKWTTEDLDAMPEDGRRRELLDGVLIMSPSPTAAHQKIAMRLGVALEETCPDELPVSRITPRHL
jgi:Uma2 family endonuclease